MRERERKRNNLQTTHEPFLRRPTAHVSLRVGVDVFGGDVACVFWPGATCVFPLVLHVQSCSSATLFLTCGAGQVSPMMGACDQNQSHKRKMPSPFISYATSSQGVVQLAPSSKRHAGAQGAKAGGADRAAEGSENKFSLLSEEAGGKEEGQAEEVHYANGGVEGQASPALSMISCGSMSAFALGVASGNGGRPLDMQSKGESAGVGLIEQAAATVDS